MGKRGSLNLRNLFGKKSRDHQKPNKKDIPNDPRFGYGVKRNDGTLKFSGGRSMGNLGRQTAVIFTPRRKKFKGIDRENLRN